MPGVSTVRSHLTKLGLLLILAFVFFRLQSPLNDKLEKVRQEQKVNRELSQHKEEYLSSYQNILGQQKLPASKLLDSNEWIQVIQGFVSDDQLLLQELKPIRKGKAQKRGGSLYLVVEGQMTKILNFFYRISAAEDLIYVQDFSLSSVDESSDTVRAQVTLGQF